MNKLIRTEMLRHLMSSTIREFAVSPASKLINSRRQYTANAGKENKQFVVTVVGHAGGLGQIICYGLKFNPLIKELRLYDIGKACPGVALDLSHIPSKTELQVYCNKDDICQALECTNIVVIAAGSGRKPGQGRDTLLETNTKVINDVIPAIARASKDAHIVIASSPINSLVPYASIVMEKNGICNIKKLYGVTYVNIIRAKMLLASQLCIPFEEVNVPVIGGHSACTIMPVLSADKNGAGLNEEQRKEFVKLLQSCGDKILEAKGSNAVLAPGYSTAKFVHDILCGMSGKETITTAYIGGNCTTQSPFFASPFKVGKEGILEVLPLPKLSEDEEQLLCEVVKCLLKDIQAGLDLAKKC